MLIYGDHQFFGGRLGAAAFVVCLALGLMTTRVWYLQGIKGTYFRDLSENNRTRTIRTQAPRGNVYDREGRVLVRNRPSFDVGLLLEDISDVDHIVGKLASLSGREEAELQERLSGRSKHRPFEPKVVMSDISRRELARISAHTHELPGVIVQVNPARTYPNGTLASHVLGYAREISQKQLDKSSEKRYRLGDVVGQAGIEKTGEEYLRGDNGYVQVEVDAMGNRRSELGIVDDRNGRDLYLTLDVDLQRIAEEALVGEKGAIAAIDPQNGDVLVLASAPAFDANIFSGEMASDAWKGVSADKRRPLINRTIRERYAPGSTFKLMMGVAGLNEKKVSVDTKFYCPGYYLFAGRRYHCHKRAGHGMVNLKQSMYYSCDSYFYQLGQKLGIDLIHKYAKLFGLGLKSGIDLPGERSGIAPSSKWKLNYLGERWYPGETLSVSIGQGFLSVTPLQMAVATATLANGGIRYRPKLVKKSIDPETGVQHVFMARKASKLDVDNRIIETIKSYAQAVVHHERGTGKRARVEGIEVGGKTGTAQRVALGKETLRKEFQDDAWFVAFAPVEDPTIALAVIVENGGGGGATAAPIAQKILEKHFRKQGLLPPEIIYGPFPEEQEDPNFVT